MKSYPSHSSSQAKNFGGQSWILTWVLALTLFLAGVVQAESAWRHLGYRPSAVDSPALWKFWYVRAVHGGPQTVAIIGTSRIQAGISTSEIRKRLPGYRVAQLAKYASGSPIGVLRALASDARFNGIVICDTIEPFLLKQFWEDQRKLFEYAGGTSDGVDALASAMVLERLAITNSDSGVASALKELVNRGALPIDRHIRMNADRSIEFDFSGVKNLKQFTEETADTYRSRYEAGQVPTPEGFLPDIKEIENFVDNIRARGGQVVFLRMPSSGKRLALEEEYHPKNKYWDRFAAMSRGVWIQSGELADARGWESPDESHLDYRDTDRFTSALIDELLRRNVIGTRQTRLASPQ